MSAATHSTTALVAWVLLALVIGSVVGLTVGSAATAPALRRRVPRRDRDGDGTGPAAPPPGPGGRPAFDVDDLPGFLEHPPGTPGPHPVAPAGATAAARVPAPAGRTLLAMVAAAVLLVLVAVAIAVVDRAAGDDPGDGGDPAPAATSAPAPPPAEVTGPVPAGALASRSVDPGTGGLSVRAAFGTVLLERRAAGVTVTRPQLALASDGDRTLVHVLLPTYNCLVREPPPDPERAGCARGATEHADLATPDLRVTRRGDGVQLAGVLATYTRPASGPAVYTGRSYRVGASLSAGGPVRDGDPVPASGVLRLGQHSAPTTGEPAATVLLPGG